MPMSDLDQKTNAIFAGKVVRKDLVRKVKVGANVPVYVLEYLLGKYCATDDPRAIDAGLRLVNTTLANNFVRPDEANKAQSHVKEKGHYTLIDKVDDAQDLLRIRHLCPGERCADGACLDGTVWQYQSAGRRHGPLIPSICTASRCHPRRLGLSRSPPLLHPWLGNPQDAGAVFHRPLWLRRQLSGRGAERAPPPQFYRDHRPLLCAGVPLERPRCEGRAQNRVGFNQVVVPPW